MLRSSRLDRMTPRRLWLGRHLRGLARGLAPARSLSWNDDRMHTPKLLVLASTYPARTGDGTPQFVRDLATFEALSYQTTVLVPSVPGGACREVDGALEVRRFRFFPRRWEDLADGAILENLRSRKSRWAQVLPLFLAQVLAIRREVRAARPDVIHAHWMIPQGLAALIACPKVPKLVTVHGADLYGLRDQVSRSLIRAVLKNADAVTTMNADMRDRLIELGADPVSTVVLSMGAHVAEIRPMAAATERRTGRILFVGRLVEKKGVSVLLKALRLLDETGYDLRVVGDGPLRSQLTRESSGLPASFVGVLGREALAAEFGAAAIAVFPSVPAVSGDQDGLPVALLEAMSTGCAVVASDLPGLRDAVEDGQSGLLTKSGSAEELATALGRLLRDPQLCDQLGRAAAIRAESFSVDAIGGRYVALLDEVRARKRGAEAAGLLAAS
jgi:colanic acid/amylovoran biosynthesis glycosyltransferase